MARRLWTVTLYTSAAPSGEGCNGYVAADFGVDPMVAEPQLGQFQAATCTFRMRDKLGPKAQRYWSNRIQQSTGVFTMPNGQRTDLPFIKVLDTTDGDAASVPVFEGWIERNQLQWENDVVTGFTAVSQLSYMDRLSLATGEPGTLLNICTGTAGTGAGFVWTCSTWESGAGDYISAGVIPGDILHLSATQHSIVSVDSATVLTLATSVAGKSGASYVNRSTLETYSGHAGPLMRRALRVAGNISPNLTAGEAPDVVIRDYPLGTGQAASDWNHILRDWAAAGSNPGEVNALSDFVGSVSGDRLGFCCVHGKLYRVDLAKCSGGDTVRTTIKLTQITTVPDGESTAVSNGYRMFPYYLADGTACLCIVQATIRPLWTRTENNWLEPYAGAGQALGNLGLSALKLKNAMPATVMANAGYMILAHSLGTATKKITMSATGSYIRAISRITVMDIGDGTSGVAGVGGAFNHSTATTFHGTSRNVYTLADSVCVATPITSAASIIYIATYRQDTNDAFLRHAQWTGAWTLSEPYKTMTGRPAGGMAARSDGTRVFVCIGMEGGATIKVQGNNNAEYTKTLDKPVSRFVGAVPTGTANQMGFVLGGDNTQWLKAYYTTGIFATLVNYSGTLPTGFKVATAGTATIQANSQTGVPIVYRALDSENSEYAYAAWVYGAGGTLTLDKTYCTKSIPGALDGDFRPPFVYQDKNINNPIYRFVVPMARLDGDRLVCDWFHSGDSARAMVHLDLVASPMSVRQFVVGCAQSFGLQLKLLGADHPSGATLCKVMSRHAWTPHSLGTVTRVAQARDSQITGTEYYLGAEGNAYGEHVTVGTCPNAGERHVYPVGGPFSQPIWLRALGGWVVGAYPERNATYTNGRRIIETTIHKIVPVLPATTPYIPGYDNVYGQATLNLFTVGDITGLMTGIGFGRRTGTYRATFIEWNATDLTWTADALDPDVEECPLVVESTIVAPTTITAGSRIIHWDVMALPTNTGQTNPVDGPCAWAFTVDLCRPLRLKRYGFKLTATGSATQGGVFVAIHYDSGGMPGDEIPETRAGVGAGVSPLLGVGMDGLSTGWNWLDLDTWNNGGYTEWELAPGLYWVVPVIDRQDAAGVTKPPLVWFDSLQVTPRAKRLAFAVCTGLAELPLLNYYGNIESSWDDSVDDDVRYAPAIYLGGD